ncbi:MAG: pimeloyl-ACP methyl ester carboxylesterase [Gammaproteobacteria bacterium]|jgi:pimeloyl-ACP methyl ester carboxylesterase
MKNYLLVHGAWGAAAEFDEVVKLLSDDGSRITSIDLPGHGENKAAIDKITMDAYVQTVVDTINTINEKVILVGHSLAGAIISQVAEVIPDSIDRLIYVAAMLPKTGDTPLGLMESDEKGELLSRVTFSDDQSFGTINESDVREVLLHDVDDEALITKSMPIFLIKQAVQPFTASAQLSDENFGSVPKYYIRATQDKVLSPKLQDEMLTNWKVEQVFTLKSGHFPLTSMPEHLVDTIRMSSAVNETKQKVA